ncbi:bacterioferritin [Neisseria arctica]|uniref:Bacterioferritin-associated ferredoxin n=1 Tax=Neisseria arctica TaxID=1470200 RepID=A0A0J0YT84_9NEIS|nr:(2Fe-2S)-binding protein [Neisseria arctica]KLT73370.1 bacterioferritin [Neisseria arctica]UOO87361.1 (2Fe-2S)-binding protein [Neisseria arctica]
MFVCICNAITDRQIQETVAAGASTLSDLQAQLGVATCCGCCSDLASSFLNTANSQAQNMTVTAGINVQS